MLTLHVVSCLYPPTFSQSWLANQPQVHTLRYPGPWGQQAQAIGERRSNPFHCMDPWLFKKSANLINFISGISIIRDPAQQKRERKKKKKSWKELFIISVDPHCRGWVSSLKQRQVLNEVADENRDKLMALTDVAMSAPLSTFMNVHVVHWSRDNIHSRNSSNKQQSSQPGWKEELRLWRKGKHYGHLYIYSEVEGHTLN